jgi:hypothetical protein
MGIVPYMEAVIRQGIVQTSISTFIGVIGIEIGIGELVAELF